MTSAQANGQSPMAVHSHVYSYLSCTEARRSLPVHIADAHMELALNATSFGRPPDMLVQPTMSINYAMSFIDLPRITWADMSQSDRDAVDRFVLALHRHEDGHVAIAESYVAEVDAHLDPLHAVSVDDAQAQLHDVLEAYHAELAGRQASYDDRTDHGRKQHTESGPFHGDDTIFRCSGPP